MCVISGLGCEPSPGTSRDARSVASRDEARRGSRATPPDDGDGASGVPTSGRASASALALASAGRLLVIAIEAGGLRLVHQRSLATRPRPRRRAPRHWRGRWVVLNRQGGRLARGAFPLQRRVHALFDSIAGPATPAVAPRRVPVVWLRVPTGPGAARLQLWESGRARTGETRGRADRHLLGELGL